MRAVTHCAGHMDRPVSVPESRRCCEVSSAAGAPVTMAAEPAPLPGAVLVIATLPAAPVVPGTDAPIETDHRGERDGPPIYLALRTFRC
jgi:hypothetical protein